MEYIKFKNKEYPYKMTIAACKEFKQKCKKDILQCKFDEVEEIQWMLFLGIKYGCKAEDNIEYLELADLDSLDLKEMISLVEQVNPKTDLVQKK